MPMFLFIIISLLLALAYPLIKGIPDFIESMFDAKRVTNPKDALLFHFSVEFGIYESHDYLIKTTGYGLIMGCNLIFLLGSWTNWK